MPARLPPNLLDRSARESARLLALSYLDQTDLAQQRLGDAREPEALHDFRVGLRRFRTALSAYKALLEDSVTGKMRRRVRRLAGATNAGRDAEVHLEWLGKQVGALGPDGGPGFYWLLGRLERRRQEMHEPGSVDLARRYATVSDKLRRALSILRIELTNGRAREAPTFGEATGELIVQHVEAFRAKLGAIHDAADVEQVHRARIALKRLRYLVEPVARRNRRARALIRRFKEGQDLLGQHHDLHVLAGEIAALRPTLAPERRAVLEAGLATLARRAEDGAAAAFGQFHILWGGEPGDRILRRAEELGRELVTPPVQPISTPTPADPEAEENGDRVTAATGREAPANSS